MARRPVLVPGFPWSEMGAAVGWPPALHQAAPAAALGSLWVWAPETRRRRARPGQPLGTGDTPARRRPGGRR